MGGDVSKNSKSPGKNSKNEEIFKQLSRNKTSINKDDLRSAWKDTLDSYLYKRLEDYLYSSSKGLTLSVFNEFVDDITSGNFDDKAELILKLASQNGLADHKSLQQFVTSIIHSIIKLEERTKQKSFLSWGQRVTSDQLGSRFADHVLGCAGEDKLEYSPSDVRNMLYTFESFMSVLFSVLLGASSLQTSMFPSWMRLQSDFKLNLPDVSVMDLEDIFFINNSLPAELQKKWRLLFSTKIHGESFSRLSGQIVNEGPTLIILRDSHDHVFGGFAPENWTMNPKFVGEPSCFLFTLRPKINFYPATNFNCNFQYLNTGQQTLPNGLGMGGKLEYFGLWLDSEFGKGVTNDSCTTFRNFKRLSHDKEFICRDLEVWGVGERPQSAEERGERTNASVLDKNSEVKAMLDMVGRKTYSDGLREEPEDED